MCFESLWGTRASPHYVLQARERISIHCHCLLSERWSVSLIRPDYTRVAPMTHSRGFQNILVA
jgi:hypothetical protein